MILDHKNILVKVAKNSIKTHHIQMRRNGINTEIINCALPDSTEKNSSN